MSNYPVCITSPEPEHWDNKHRSFMDLFDEYWAPLLGERAGGFRWAFQQLRKSPGLEHVIVETGTMRDYYRPLDFLKDGCSTLLFDRYVQRYSGRFYSVDSSLRATKYAEQFTSKRTLLKYSDSLEFFRSLTGIYQINLLYLDSLDYDKANPRESEEWHLFELLAANQWLKRKSIVMVDDNYPDGSGKGRLVRKFFSAYKLEPAYVGRQFGWIIP